MNLPILSTAAKTMSSREIAELTGKDISNVHRDIRQMLIGLYGDEYVAKIVPEQYRNRHSEFIRENADAIFSAITGDDSNWNHHEKRGFSWVRDKRGYITSFSLDYSHTMALVSGYNVKLRKAIIDRWIELEQAAAHVAPKPVITLPDFTDPAAAAIAWAAEYQAKQAAMLERDEAIRTKAQIGSRREATAMATAAKATREAAKMAELVGRAVNHACVLAVQAATGAKYAWPPLKAYCLTNGLPILRVHSEAYGEVNSYPAAAWLEVYGVDLGQLWGVAA